MQATSGVASLERSAPSDADLQDPETLRGCHTALVIAVDGATIGGDIAAMTAKEGQARLPEPGRLVGAVVAAFQRPPNASAVAKSASATCAPEPSTAARRAFSGKSIDVRRARIEPWPARCCITVSVVARRSVILSRDHV